MNKWKVYKLGDICDVRDGTHDSPKYVKYGYPLVTSKNVVDGYIDITDVNFISEDDYNKIIVRSGADDGDIIMPMIGTIGNPVVVHKTFDFAIKNVALIKFVGNDVLNKYIFYVLKSNIFNRYVDKENRGGTQKFISLGNIRSFPVPLPPIETQKKIAETLDAAAELITMHKQRLAELDNLIKSIFYDMFGDPVTNEKEWDIHKIEDTIANGKNALKAGPFGSALKKDFYVKEGYKVYGQEQVINNDATYGDYYISELKYRELENCAVQADDVLISLVGTYGKLLIIPQNFEKGIINPRLMKITFDKTRMNTTYFKYYFISKSMENVLTSMSRGGTMDILNVGIIRKLLIPLPPIELQTKFANIVTKIEEQKPLVKKAIDETQHLFDSLMNEYLE